MRNGYRTPQGDFDYEPAEDLATTENDQSPVWTYERADKYITELLFEWHTPRGLARRVSYVICDAWQADHDALVTANEQMATQIGALAAERDDLTAKLNTAQQRIAELEDRFLGLKEMPLYVEVELDDGETETPVSIVGVHPLRWSGLYPECAPTHGFYRYEWPDDESKEADNE